MNKPDIKENSFDVDDIRKVRDYLDEQMKNMTIEEIVDYINSGAEKVKARIERLRKEKAAK